jgi:hypothetical protein
MMSDAGRQKLDSVIARLRERINETRGRKPAIGEQNTKNALINPLLTALGWDLEDLDEISLEYRRKPQDNPVDYAIFLFRAPCLFVEAKALDADLSDRRWVSQTLGYATVVGVEWCVLTNGDEYRLYNSHALVDADEKLFRTVRISDASQQAFTLETVELLSKDKMGEKQLDVLWNAHFVDRRVKAALESLVQGQDAALLRLLNKRIPDLTKKDLRNSLQRADVRIDFPRLPQPAPVAVPARRQAAHSRQRSAKKTGRRATPTTYPVSLRDLIERGLIQPPLELETQYHKQRVTAVIQPDGSVVAAGVTYTSLSEAAGMARNAVKGPPTDGRRMYQTNGWTFWKYRDPQSGKLKVIDELRQQHLRAPG